MDQKEQVNKLIVDYSGELLKWVQAGGEFVKEQTPLLCQEIIKIGQINSIFDIVLGSICIIAFIFILKKSAKVFKEDDEETPRSIGCIISCVVFGIGSIVSVVIIIISVYTLLMTIFAPRLYLLQQIKELL
jgi:hypothetical protein